MECETNDCNREKMTCKGCFFENKKETEKMKAKDIKELTELEYEEYKKYEVDPKSIRFIELEGINHKFVFPNGYGASVIKHIGSYGWENDLFELAVLIKVTDDNYVLCYSTEITDDVIGNLTNEEVLELLERIKNLEGVE